MNRLSPFSAIQLRAASGSSARSVVTSLAIALLAACGGGTPDAKEPGEGGAGSGSKPAAAGDVSIETAPVAIKGLVFEPEALGRPGMPIVNAKGKTTVQKQRDLIAKEKDPTIKQAHAAVLATMLYQESKTNTAKEKELLTEARQALRDVSAAVGDKVDEITLRLLGSYELLLEDFAGAEKAWAQLVNKFPKHKELAYHKAWWSYALLRQSKNQEALAVVANEAVSEKQPELAYTTAWAKWRTGDDAGAWTALATAAKGWGENGNRAAIDRDLFLFAGRSKNVSLQQATTQLFAALNAKQPAQKYAVLAKLGQESYRFAGRWTDGIAAIEEAITVVGPAIPVDDVPALRYLQADYSVRLDQPEVTAKYVKGTLDGLAKCGAKCPAKTQQDLVYVSYITGRIFHVLYATANDVRFYQPAHDIYTGTVLLIQDDAKRNEAMKDMANLEATLKNTKAGTGTHDKGAIGALLGRHDQEVQACYESVLAGNPKLAGTLTIELESNETGAVLGASSEPKAGLEGVSLVAGCVVEQAKSWKLPKRGSKGATRIKLTYTLGT